MCEGLEPTDPGVQYPRCTGGQNARPPEDVGGTHGFEEFKRAVKRLIKTPKAYWSDSGLAMHLAGESAPRGEHLESIVVLDLLVWRQTQVPNPSVLYWRTTKGWSVRGLPSPPFHTDVS